MNIAALFYRYIDIVDNYDSSTRKMYSEDENSYVMFVDLKSYVQGMLTHYQQ